MNSQEQYLKETPMHRIVWRGLKKLVTELTSIKTMFLAFLCVAMAYQWIGDIAGIVGGLAALGVREIPSEIFTSLIGRDFQRTNGLTEAKNEKDQ